MTISDSNAVSRNNALADFEAHAGAEFLSHELRLDAEKHERRQKRDRDIEDARAIAAATALAIEEDIAAKARATFAPLAVAFPDAPRTTAGKLADAWRALDARCVEQLGAPLSHRHLATAVAAAHDVADRVAGVFFWRFDGANNAAEQTVAVVKVIMSGAVPVVVEAALRDLEIAIATRAPGYPTDPARLAAMTSRASEGAIRVALAALDEARDAEQRAEMITIAQEANPDPHLMGQPLSPEVPRFLSERLASVFR